MKRVLIIAYYWPPAGGPGVQRWLKFVTYLRDFGITPVIYVPENATYPIVDTSLVSEIPEGIEIIKTKIKEPYRFAKLFSKSTTQQLSAGIVKKKNKKSLLESLMLWVRGNFFIPDARVGWVKPSISYIESYLKKENIDTVITTGPPHSMHLIGLGLKKKLNINWVTDFRDPWTTIHYHKDLNLGSAAQKKHKDLEREVLQKSDKVIVTSAKTKKIFASITNSPIEVITNGYDGKKLSNIIRDTSFSIVHIGSFLADRNPLILWESLQELCDENEEFKNDLEIKLAGKISETVLDSITTHSLNENLTNLGYLPHNEIQPLQEKAQVLLLVEMNKVDTQVIIPGKLFEYFRAERPIIALGPPKSDVATLLNETNTGSYFTYEEKQALKSKISAHYNAYKEHRLLIDPKNIDQYHRKKLTEKLATFLA